LIAEVICPVVFVCVPVAVSVFPEVELVIVLTAVSPKVVAADLDIVVVPKVGVVVPPVTLRWLEMLIEGEVVLVAPVERLAVDLLDILDPEDVAELLQHMMATLILYKKALLLLRAKKTDNWLL
jgi:hypothetical protein